jgi:endonuclease G
MGYSTTFLDEEIALPTFSITLESRVLRVDGLRDGVYRDYIHYSIAMHRDRRSPLFAALNIDQGNLRSVRRGPWDTDDLIGVENQMDNAYYYRNRWDRGHLARRASAAWGATASEARHASDATMFYTNAALQFDAFNQDEWLALEDWVKDLRDPADDKITSFSGPVYGEDAVFVAPENRRPAAVPAAFFKIICFMDRRGRLDVRAFLVPQDRDAMADWRGSSRVNHQTYQTTVAEIEQLTGLIFDEKVADRNPLYFHHTEDRVTDLGIAEDGFPENIPVDRPVDLVGRDADETDIRRTRLDDASEDVFIAAALPNPKGTDRGREWVSILNLKPVAVSLDGWVLEDLSGREATLSGTLEPGESMRLQGESLGSVLLGNRGDVLTLWDANGAERRRVDRVRYEKIHVKEDRAILFPRAHRE